MAVARRTDPLVRKYVSKSGKKIHVRITSVEYDLDLRGTGRTVLEAVARVEEKVTHRSKNENKS